MNTDENENNINDNNTVKVAGHIHMYDPV